MHLSSRSQTDYSVLRNIFPRLCLLAEGKGWSRHVVNEVLRHYVDCCSWRPRWALPTHGCTPQHPSDPRHLHLSCYLLEKISFFLCGTPWLSLLSSKFWVDNLWRPPLLKRSAPTKILNGYFPLVFGRGPITEGPWRDLKNLAFEEEVSRAVSKVPAGKAHGGPGSSNLLAFPPKHGKRKQQLSRYGEKGIWS